MIMSHLFFLALLHRLQSIDGDCVGVKQCNCETVDSKRVINCRSQNLNTVPRFEYNSGLFHELILENNGITEIPRSAFVGLYVEIINLSGNKLKTLANEAFYGVEKSLTKLIIGMDSAAAFPTNSLLGLANLESLHISGYGQPTLPDDCLKNVPQLKEFSVTDGALVSLSSIQLKSMVNIKNLNLMNNALERIPKEALFNSLTGVRILSMANNKITNIASDDLFGSIETLDLSGNNIGSNIHPDAFLRLEGSLKYLNLNSCSISNSALVAISKLTSLISLQLQRNSITTIPPNIFLKLTILQMLNLANNDIQRLSKDVFNGLLHYLVTLNLEGNVNLRLTATDVFSNFEALNELNLNDINGLQLNADSFLKSQNLIETLSLARTNIGPSIFSIINKTISIKNLFLKSAAISAIPDYAFKLNNKLQMLDLSSNSIDAINPKTMFGLKSSLVQLNLDSNKISSIGECVFYQFQKINYTLLGLTNNPLKCDCALQWLYYAASVQNPSQWSNLKWLCSDGNLISNINPSLFTGCPPTNTSCQIAFPPSENTTTDVPLSISVDEITSHSALLQWTLQSASSIYAFQIVTRIVNLNNSEVYITLSQRIRQFRLDSLTPASNYMTCVNLDISSSWRFARQQCAQFQTPGASNPAMIGAIVGGIIAGILLVLTIIGVVICLRKKSQADARVERKTPKSRLSTAPSRTSNLSFQPTRGSINSSHITPTQFSENEIDKILTALMATQQITSETISSHLSNSRPSLHSYGYNNELNADQQQNTNKEPSLSSYNSANPDDLVKSEQNQRRRRRGERNRAFAADEVFSVSKNVPLSTAGTKYYENALDTEV